jgi:hypothetical protein
VKQIKLSNYDLSFLVDDEDFDNIKNKRWVGTKNKKDNTLYVTSSKFGKLHAFLLNPAPGYIVDHIDGNGLNNQKNNLRCVLPSENAKNRRKTFYIKDKKVTSKYKGVLKRRNDINYSATIWANGKSIHLGRYENEVEAALAYDKASKIYHGEFGKINFPNDIPKIMVKGRSTQALAANKRFRNSEGKFLPTQV